MQAKSHQGFRLYFANTSWLFAEQVLRMAVNLIVGVWVARYLGPEQFGIFSYALAFVAIFGSVAKMGLDGIVVRNLVNDPNSRDIYLGTAFWLKVSGAILTLSITFAAMLYIKNDFLTNLYIAIIAFGLAFQSFEVVDFYFQSKALSKFVSLCKMIQLVLSSALKLMLIAIDADLFWFVVISLFDQISLGIALYLSYKYQKLGSFYMKFDLLVARILLRDSWPLILSSIVIAIYSRIDQILIKEFLGEREAGVYVAALRLCEFSYFIPALISNSLFHSILEAKKISSELYKKRLYLMHKMMLWISIALILIIYLISDTIVSFLYGSLYHEAGVVLKISLFSLIFVFSLVGTAQYLIAENMVFFAFFRNALGMSVNVISNYMLIPIYGINGAAMSSVLGYFSSTVLANLMYRPMHSTLRMQLMALTAPILYLRLLYGKQ